MNAIDLRQAIPTPLAEDNEEVHWALSTAAALWATGDRGDALRWLRKAAETANDLEEDSRALELYKAAATIRSTLLPPALSAADTIRSPAPADSPSIPPPPASARSSRSASGVRSVARVKAPPKSRPLPKPLPPPLPAKASAGRLAAEDRRRIDSRHPTSRPPKLPPPPNTEVTVVGPPPTPEMLLEDGEETTRVIDKTMLAPPARAPFGPPTPRVPATVQAVHVAVARGAGGEPRLIPIASGASVPEGAVSALLVPTCEADAAALVALLSQACEAGMRQA